LPVATVSAVGAAQILTPGYMTGGWKHPKLYHMTGGWPHPLWAISLADVKRGLFQNDVPGRSEGWYWCNQPHRPLHAWML